MTGADIVKKYEALEGNARGNWMNLWQECADWCMPTNDNINRIRVEGQEKPPQRMIDTCIEANYNFASGFFSHLYPTNTLWAKYRHPNPAMMSRPGVSDYFEAVSRIVHQMLIGSNFAQEEFQSLLCMGTFGTNILSCEEDEKKYMKFRNYTVDKMVIDENYLGEVDMTGRKVKLTPRQAIQQFGEEALMKAQLERVMDDARQVRDKKYEFIHMVAPRADFDSSKKDVTNKPFASYWVSCDTKEIVKESGFDYNPYKVARFITGNDEVPGRGPMSMVLGTSRRTNTIYRSMIVSAEQHANPQWLVPDDDSVNGLSGRAGAVVEWRLANGQFGKPERLQPNGDPGIAMEMYQLHDDQIKRMFFNHLFRTLDDYRNMTATEVNERVTIDRMSISPFVSRYLDEHVSPVMEFCYYVGQKRKLMPPMPAALTEDPNFEVEYIGPLAQSTASFETLGAIQTCRIFNELGSVNPKFIQAQDYVDADVMFKETWHANSGSAGAINADEEVVEQREAQAQMMQQQQEIDNMPAIADGMYKASQIEGQQ